MTDTTREEEKRPLHCRISSESMHDRHRVGGSGSGGGSGGMLQLTGVEQGMEAEGRPSMLPLWVAYIYKKKSIFRGDFFCENCKIQIFGRILLPKRED